MPCNLFNSPQMCSHVYALSCNLRVPCDAARPLPVCSMIATCVLRLAFRVVCLCHETRHTALSACVHLHLNALLMHDVLPMNCLAVNCIGRVSRVTSVRSES